MRPHAAQHQNQDERGKRHRNGGRDARCPRRPTALKLRKEFSRLLRELETEQLLDLAHQNDRGDAGREADRHRIGNELDVAAEPQEADHRHDRSGHQRRQHQPVIAVALHHRGDEHDEGPRRAADLHAAAAEQRHDETADDRRVEPALRADAGGDRDRHRQRQRHDGDRQAGERIRAQVREPVALAKHRDELGREQFERGRRTVTDGGGCHGVEQQTEEA